MSECPGRGPEGKHIGCCGYDELAVKPATTRPFSASDVGRPRVSVKVEKEIEGRPRIQVKAVGDAGPQKKFETSAGAARLPDGKMGNVFSQAQPSWKEPQRPRVVVKEMGQLEPEKVPSPSTEAVLKREAAPQGLTKTEASILASDLQNAIEKTELALTEGEQCFGVDQGLLDGVRKIQAGLLDFSMDAPDTERVDMDADDLSMIERVFECASVYDKKKASEKMATMAFVAGGLVIGTIVLVVVS